jgi:Glycosyl hydrolase catalytic core
MSPGSSLHRKLLAATVVACCAAGGVASMASRPAADRAATLTALTIPVAAAPASSIAPAAPANAKKGAGAWAFSGVRKALSKSGVSWYYTWATSHNGISAPAGAAFVPMIWGPGSVTAAQLREAKRHGHILLGFNEPDMSSQSNMTVAQALRLWPRLMATGMRLGSPAVAFDGNTPGGWLDRFMRGAARKHYRVNFITLHWYGGDFATRAAVSQLKTYLHAVWARYHKPIWLTEFALIRFGSTAVFPSPARQAAFVTAATTMLQRLSYVHRYAWFALPASSGDGTAGLFRAGAVPTAAGRAFEKVDA